MTPAALLAWYDKLRKQKHTGMTVFVWHLGGIRRAGSPFIGINGSKDWIAAKQE